MSAAPRAAATLSAVLRAGSVTLIDTLF